MRFFFDNTLPPKLARAIAALVGDDHTVIHLRDQFAPETIDLVWLSKLGAEGDWIIVTGDPRITRNPYERKAWQDAGLTAFFLKKGWTNQKFWVQAAKLVQWWPDIMDQARKVTSGAGFYVPLGYTGRFEQV